MTIQELEIKNNVLKSILDLLEKDDLKILQNKFYNDGTFYAHLGLLRAINIIMHEYYSEPVCLTVGVQ